MAYDFIVGYNITEDELNQMQPGSMKDAIRRMGSKLIRELLSPGETVPPMYYTGPSLDGRSLICCKF